MRKKIGLLLFQFILSFSFLSAQTPQSPNSAEIFLRLKKLNVLGSVLYLAAHPDDENSRLIAYMAKERLYRTGYLSMTRGDGGQNLIGDEQGVELGLIRTQEMLAARRIDGAEQFFTRAFDFGFSKSTEEALNTWGKEKILSDVVWVIRRFQPDVIITRFPEEFRSAFHGHHSASAVLAHEAFSAAADPTRFPEQLKEGVKPWQAKRLLWNTFNFGGNANTVSEDQMKIDVGVYNAVLGKSYGEIAAESRSQHKSQGAALTRTRGQALEYFKLVAGENASADPMEGVVTTWNRVEGASTVQSLINALIQHYSLSNPERSVPGLVNLYREMLKLPDGYWKNEKLKEVQQLVEICSGLWLEATVQGPYAVQGEPLAVNFAMINRLNTDVTVNEITMTGYDSMYRQHLDFNKNYFLSGKILVADNQPITQPYWLVEPMSPGSYNVKDPLLIGDPQSKPAYEAAFRLKIDGQDFVFTRALQYKYLDPVRGELYEPLTVLPPVTARFDPETIVFDSEKEKEFAVHTINHGDRNVQPEISLTPIREMDIRSNGSLHNSGLAYSAKPLNPGPAVYYSSILLHQHGSVDSARELKTISYDHIPRIDYFTESKAKFVVANVQIAGKRIGYIEGAGDKVPEALQQMGYEVTLLKEKDIVPGNLAQFDAILAGVRAYDVHDWLSAKYDVLMDYVKGGGNLIVQYNRTNLGTPKTKIGPYPFSIGNIRVTDENAAVNFIEPNHPILNYPNKITAKDFEGWIQERGIYYVSQSDSNYHAILSMHDPGEPDRQGSLIVASYGKGSFVYTGLDFFRELPAGVPGAYRLLANLIALNHKRGF